MEHQVGKTERADGLHQEMEALVHEHVIKLQSAERDYGFSFETMPDGLENGVESYSHCVTELTEGGVAQKAGLRFGDKIVSVNNSDVQRVDKNEISAAMIEDLTSVTLTVLRINGNPELASKIPSEHQLLTGSAIWFMDRIMGHMTRVKCDVKSTMNLAIPLDMKIAEGSDNFFVETAIYPHANAVCRFVLNGPKKVARFRPDGIWRDGRRVSIVDGGMGVEIDNNFTNKRDAAPRGRTIFRYDMVLTGDIYLVSLSQDGKQLATYGHYKPISRLSRAACFAFGFLLTIFLIVALFLKIVF